MLIVKCDVCLKTLTGDELANCIEGATIDVECDGNGVDVPVEVFAGIKVSDKAQLCERCAVRIEKKLLDLRLGFADLRRMAKREKWGNVD